MLNDLKFPDPKGNIVYKVVCVLYFFRPFHLHTISPLWNFLNKNIKKEKEIKVNNSLQSAITSCKNPRYIFFKSFVNGQCTCTMCVIFSSEILLRECTAERDRGISDCSATDYLSQIILEWLSTVKYSNTFINALVQRSLTEYSTWIPFSSNTGTTSGPFSSYTGTTSLWHGDNRLSYSTLNILFN